MHVGAAFPDLQCYDHNTVRWVFIIYTDKHAKYKHNLMQPGSYREYITVMSKDSSYFFKQTATISMAIQIISTKVNEKLLIHLTENQVIFCWFWLLIPTNCTHGLILIVRLIINVNKLPFFTKKRKKFFQFTFTRKCFLCSWSL